MDNIELDEKTLRARNEYEAQKKRLKAIPARHCKFMELKRSTVTSESESWFDENMNGNGKSLVVYYKGEEVFRDYLLPDGDSYLGTALVLFKTATSWNKQSKWLNLFWLIALRDIVRENYNHGIGLDDILYDEKPFTYKRLLKINRLIKEMDPYATVRN